MTCSGGVGITPSFGPENMERNPNLYGLSEKGLLIFLPVFILAEHTSPEKRGKITSFSLHLQHGHNPALNIL